jgi:hypothetical protein
MTGYENQSTFNLNFCFQEMNFERPMGYFLAGLIDGDGHISKNVTISFHKRDIKLHKKSKIT